MTGPEFAAARGNDSSTWTPADFEAELNLAEIDALPVIRFIRDRLHPATPETVDCWFCSAPNPATATTCGFCCHHLADNPAA